MLPSDLYSQPTQKTLLGISKTIAKYDVRLGFGLFVLVYLFFCLFILVCSFFYILSFLVTSVILYVV